MPTLDTHFRTRAALQRAITARNGEAGLFVPGEHAPAPGEFVRVHVTADGLGAGTWIEGHARERCVMGDEPGLWVAVPAVLSAPYFFLLNWSLGWSVESGRRGTRYPTEFAAHVCARSGPRAGVRVRATVRNASVGGAQVSTSLPLAAGLLVTLEVETGGRPHSFAARVAWSNRLHAGLRVLLESALRGRAWAQVIAAARNAAGFVEAADGLAGPSVGSVERAVERTGEIALTGLGANEGRDEGADEGADESRRSWVA